MTYCTHFGLPDLCLAHSSSKHFILEIHPLLEIVNTLHYFTQSLTVMLPLLDPLDFFFLSFIPTSPISLLLSHSQVMLCVSAPNFPVDRLVPAPRWYLVALIGQRGISVLELPEERYRHGISERTRKASCNCRYSSPR